MPAKNGVAPIATSSEGYAKYAMGGPSVELLFTAYNKYKGKTGTKTYVAEVKSITGYQISNNNGSSYTDSISYGIENDKKSADSLYSVSNLQS